MSSHTQKSAKLLVNLDTTSSTLHDVTALPSTSFSITTKAATWVAASLLTAAVSGCGSCGNDPISPDGGPIRTDSGNPDNTCISDENCNDGEICSGGVCLVPLDPIDAGSDAGIPVDLDGGLIIPDGGEVVEDAGPVGAGILSIREGDLVEFGAQRLGTPVERILHVVNTGNASATVLQILLEDNETGEFQATPLGASNTPVAPGEEMIVQVVHTPADGLPDDATLKLVHTGTGNLIEVNLFAEFKGDAVLSLTNDAAQLEPDVTQLDFGPVPIGSSASQVVFVRNRGSSDSILSLSSLAISPANSNFAVAPSSIDSARFLSSWDGACDPSLSDVLQCPAGTIACSDEGVCVDGAGVPVDSIPVTVTFSPTLTGEQTTNLALGHSGAGELGVREIALHGQGVAGVLTVQPSPLEFTDAFIGRTSRINITVRNDGDAPLVLQSFSVSGANPPFVVENPFALPLTIDAGDSNEIPVAFTPTIVGQVSRTLSVTSSAGVAQVELLGTARRAPVAQLRDPALVDVSNSAFAFGDVQQGTARTQEIAIVNVGAGELNIRNVRLEGPQVGRFAVSPQNFAVPLSPAVVQDPNVAGAFQPRAALSVTYNAAGVTGAVDQATLVVTTDDPDRPELRLSLTARTINPRIVVSPTTVNFGAVRVGGPVVTQTITVRNNGFGPLVVSSITPPAGNIFRITPDRALPARIEAADAPINITVSFVPVDNTSVGATLTLVSNDATQPQTVVNLGGSGDVCPARSNATLVVNPQTGACQYTCNAGFHGCGDSCLANNSPDSCGASCTPCNARSNTTRGCTAATGTCTYECNTQFFDLNSDRSVAQGLGSNGCEYRCDVASPTNESCNQLDDDCDGTRDEGLSADGFDGANSANNICTAAARLQNVVENSAALNTNATIYPFPAVGGNDEDWFVVRAVESEELCNPFFDSDEFFRTTITLTGIPPGSDYDIEVFDNSCNGQRFTGSNGGNADEVLQLDWDGSCSLFGTDERNFFIRVFRFSGGDCRNYQLRVEHRSR